MIVSVFKDKPQNETEESKTELILPTFRSEVILSSASALDVYNGKAAVSDVYKSGAPYKSFVFEYSLSLGEAELVISEDPSFTTGMTYTLSSDDSYVTVDNLKTGTKYYYRVTAGETSSDGFFKTAEGVRFISMGKLTNVRDVGGYLNADGKSVAQGMIIRGEEIDGLVDPAKYLTSDEARSAAAEMGFVYEFDLRSDGIYQGTAYRSYFGDDIGHGFYSAPKFGQIFNKDYKDRLKQIFTDLASAENYPMYMHCTNGADRTGTVTFLLLGILNVPEEDMIREFTLSGFSSSEFVNKDKLSPIISGLENYEGDTVNERIESFLTEYVGVTDEQISSIRNILLEH